MTERFSKIVLLLLKSKEVMAVKDIAKKLGVSEKTVRNELKGQSEALEAYGVKLIKKPSCGIYLEGSEQSMKHMLVALSEVKFDFNYLARHNRKMYILGNVLFKRNYLTMIELEEHLFVSSSSIYKELTEIRQWLANREIEFKRSRKRGFYVSSGEKRTRRAIYDFLKQTYNETRDVKNLMHTKAEASLANVKDLLYEPYDNGDYHVTYIQRVMDKVQKALGVLFVPADRNMIELKLAISIYRMLKGHHVTMRDVTMNVIMNAHVWPLSEMIKEDVYKHFQVDMSKDELGYLLGIVLSAKTDQSREDEISLKELAQNTDMANRIFDLVKTTYNVTYDDGFIRGLTHHLNSFSNNIKYDIYFSNPALATIMTDFKAFFSLSKKLEGVFKEVYNFAVTDDELGYIALHMAALVEKQKKPLTTNIYYHASFSEAKFLSHYLSNRFSEIAIQSTQPISAYDREAPCDLIIATKPIVTGKPFIVIDAPLKVGEQLEALTGLIETFYKAFNDRRLKTQGNTD